MGARGPRWLRTATGAGLPTVGNTHEIAQEADPSARVVYVDHDPVVLAHARSMLHNVPNTTIIEQDLGGLR